MQYRDERKMECKLRIGLKVLQKSFVFTLLFWLLWIDYRKWNSSNELCHVRFPLVIFLNKSMQISSDVIRHLSIKESTNYFYIPDNLYISIYKLKSTWQKPLNQVIHNVFTFFFLNICLAKNSSIDSTFWHS